MGSVFSGQGNANKKKPGKKFLEPMVIPGNSISIVFSSASPNPDVNLDEMSNYGFKVTVTGHKVIDHLPIMNLYNSLVELTGACLSRAMALDVPRDDDEDLPTVDDKGVPKLTGSDTLGSHLISDVMETELFRGGLVELSDLTPDSSYTSFVKDLQR